MDKQVHLDFAWVMVTKLTGCGTLISKIYGIHGGSIFGPKRHNFNKLGKGSLDDATHLIMNTKALFRQNIFMFSLCSPKHLTHWMGHFLSKGHNLIELIQNGYKILCILETPKSVVW